MSPPPRATNADRLSVYLIEYASQLVVVPRVCELCLAHNAVYLHYGWFPSTYLCRECVDVWLPAVQATMPTPHNTEPF